MAQVFDAAREADAIVFTGYRQVEGADQGPLRATSLAGLVARVITAWRESGISTPLFRKTSCGVSYAHQMADYNGYFGFPELCDICPAAQRIRCGDAYQEPTTVEINSALAHLGYQGDYLVEDGHIWSSGLGEQKRHAVQHNLRHQIWDVPDGRSLPRNVPDNGQVAAMSELRAEFERAARYEND